MKESILTDGRGLGYSATVDSDGNLRVLASGSVEAVVKRAEAFVTTNGGGDVTSTSSEIIPETAGRTALYLTNNSASDAIFIKFGGSATTNDLRIPPGGLLALTIAPTDAVHARTDTGTARLAVVELRHDL